MDLRHVIDDLLEPASVLPEQVSRTGRWTTRESATHRLMIGILRDAVELYLKSLASGNRVPTKRLREVVTWFGSHDREWPFSFERVCEALGFEADYLRSGLYRKSVEAARTAAPSRRHEAVASCGAIASSADTQ